MYDGNVSAINTSLLQDTGVDTDCYMFLRYSGDRTALLSASVAKNLQNEEIIYGTKGSMRVSTKQANFV